MLPEATECIIFFAAATLPTFHVLEFLLYIFGMPTLYILVMIVLQFKQRWDPFLFGHLLLVGDAFDVDAQEMGDIVQLFFTYYGLFSL